MSKTQHASTSCVIMNVPKHRLWYGLGPNCIGNMLAELTRLSYECVASVKKNQELNMTAENMLNFKTATRGSICSVHVKEVEITCKKHGHRTG